MLVTMHSVLVTTQAVLVYCLKDLAVSGTAVLQVSGSLE